MLAGIVCYFATHYCKRVLVIDDALDVFSVHGVGGMLGTILTAVFAVPALGGLGLDGYVGSQLLIQLLGITVTIVWGGIISFILLKLLDIFIGLRVDEEEETEGLDFSSHGEKGYTF